MVKCTDVQAGICQNDLDTPIVYYYMKNIIKCLSLFPDVDLKDRRSVKELLRNCLLLS